jgi:hypothetical protein
MGCRCSTIPADAFTLQIPAIEGVSEPPYLSVMAKREDTDIELLAGWTLSPAVTLGSAIRAKGILQEIQARLPPASKKAVALDGNEITLAMPASAKAAFKTAAAIVSNMMAEAEALPIIPREIQDILTIKASERHRWLADGRLPSAGTRTVRLAGRARRITFHVFDPKVVEDLLDRGAVDEWRVEDAEARAEKRQRAADEVRRKRLANKKAKSEKRPSPASKTTPLSFPAGQNSTAMGFFDRRPRHRFPVIPATGLRNYRRVVSVYDL